MRPLIVAAMMLCCACALPQVVPEANTEFKATGEINLRGKSASFDKYRVRSPKMNVTARTDGSWAGTLNNAPIDVSVDENAVRGVDLVLNRSESKPGHLIITGQFQGKIMRFEFDSEQAMIRSSSLSNTYHDRATKPGWVAYGPNQDFTMTGDAALEAPPWPQFGLALLAAF